MMAGGKIDIPKGDGENGIEADDDVSEEGESANHLHTKRPR